MSPLQEVPGARHAQRAVEPHTPLQQLAELVQQVPVRRQVYPVSHRHWPLSVSKWQTFAPCGQFPPQVCPPEGPQAGDGVQTQFAPLGPRTNAHSCPSGHDEHCTGSEVVVVVQLGPLPGGGHASQQLLQLPTVPCLAVQCAPSLLIRQLLPVLVVRQQVTRPGLPQVEWAAHFLTSPTQPLLLRAVCACCAAHPM